MFYHKAAIFGGALVHPIQAQAAAVGKILELPEAKYLCSQADIRNPLCLQAGIGYLPNNKPTSSPLCGSLGWTYLMRLKRGNSNSKYN